MDYVGLHLKQSFALFVHDLKFKWDFFITDEDIEDLDAELRFKLVSSNVLSR